ncbi:hypothetical protein HY486_02720, partial [Candidatus Woesearchaeota archaeon]|nr:hypothetical protein [Candidatus Woesearchaeota archaeon]
VPIKPQGPWKGIIISHSYFFPGWLWEITTHSLISISRGGKEQESI